MAQHSYATALIYNGAQIGKLRKALLEVVLYQVLAVHSCYALELLHATDSSHNLSAPLSPLLGRSSLSVVDLEM